MYSVANFLLEPNGKSFNHIARKIVVNILTEEILNGKMSKMRNGSVQTKENLENGWKTRQTRQTDATRNRSISVSQMWSNLPRSPKQKKRSKNPIIRLNPHSLFPFYCKDSVRYSENVKSEAQSVIIKPTIAEIIAFIQKSPRKR